MSGDLLNGKRGGLRLDAKELHRRSLLRLAGARDGKVYIGPETVHLHLTSRCNLSCGYCWHHSPGNPARLAPRQELSFPQFRKIILDCLGLKVDSVVLSGEGEPTLHPRFPDMMALLDKAPLSTTLITNGTFSSSFYRHVRKADRLIINLGAVDRRGYKSLHGRDLFERVVENVRYWVRFRDTKKASFSITLFFVVNKMNIDQKKKMEALAKDLGVDSLIQREISRTRYNKNLWLASPRLAQWQKALPSCFNGWYYASIAMEGNISLCCHIDQMDIANIQETSLREAWFSSSFMRVRLSGRSGKLQKDFKECANCLFRERNVAIAEKVSKACPGN